MVQTTPLRQKIEYVEDHDERSVLLDILHVHGTNNTFTTTSNGMSSRQQVCSATIGDNEAPVGRGGEERRGDVTSFMEAFLEGILVRARIECANSQFVTPVAINSIKAYEDLAEVFVEGACCFIDTGNDILMWCLLDSLRRASRGRVSEHSSIVI